MGHGARTGTYDNPELSKNFVTRFSGISRHSRATRARAALVSRTTCPFYWRAYSRPSNLIVRIVLEGAAWRGTARFTFSARETA
jgi:hypothetical protein